MTGARVYISGMGVISSLGVGVAETLDALRNGERGLKPLTLFPDATGLPVGEIPGMTTRDAAVPRTHQLARLAADQAMAEADGPPDAVVLGVTTGGMPATEKFLEEKKTDPVLYRRHAVSSVAEDLSLRYGCRGPAITVSTACSSGAAAVKLALEMLRAGLVERVLAGGVDALCRLTYFGFKSLQLMDPEGSRPLDKDRRGMSLAEGAAVLLLSNRPEKAMAEVLGAGLSCDAYHPARPDPEGRGALAAMRAALANAGIDASDVDYVNLHGTGTPDNDFSEAAALRALFPGEKPLLSSVKGAFGHSLAASGAVEAAVSAMCLSQGFVPANTGWRTPDPDLGLDPVAAPTEAPVRCVLSNAFGFGGNNASIVVGLPGRFHSSASSSRLAPLAVLGYACLTGAGDTEATLARLSRGEACKGALSLQEISKNLPPRFVRRLKRLPRLALALAMAAYERSGLTSRPASVFMGTGWGALSETHDFLTQLFESRGRFASPTDFVGSVHNAPAGQIALHFQAAGANLATSGGDYSFEQALLAAHLLALKEEGASVAVGADEFHSVLSRRFDESVSTDEIPSDGGGAFCLGKGGEARLFIQLRFYENGEKNPEAIASLIKGLGGPDVINAAYGGLLAGIPGACRREGEEQLQQFLSLSGFTRPVIDYRKLTGEFASSSAVAAVMAAGLLEAGAIPVRLAHGSSARLDGKGILVLGLGKFVTAMEASKR